MERMKVRLTAEQAARLRQLAGKQGVPITKLIRDAVDRIYGTDMEPSLDEKWERANAGCWDWTFRSSGRRREP